MGDRPVWLLDIDGVLNGMGRCGWGGPSRRGQVLVDGEAWRMRWAPQLIERINRLHRGGAVEIRWCTTWIDVGPDVVARLMGLPLGLPCAYPPSPPAHRDAKLQVALEVAGTGRRLIWTDDDAIPPGGLVRESLDAAGALLIAPDERRGLRPEHLDAIDAICVAMPRTSTSSKPS